MKCYSACQEETADSDELVNRIVYRYYSSNFINIWTTNNFERNIKNVKICII